MFLTNITFANFPFKSWFYIVKIERTRTPMRSDITKFVASIISESITIWHQAYRFMYRPSLYLYVSMYCPSPEFDHVKVK